MDTLTPQRILEVGIGFWPAKVLLSAVELGQKPMPTSRMRWGVSVSMGSVDEGRYTYAGQPRHALDVVAVLHEPDRQEREGQVACRIDPERRRPCPEAPEGPRAAQVAEEARDDSFAADEEPEPDRGGERLPAAHLHRVVEERVRLVTGVVARGELEHRGRQDARAVELAPAPQHLDEAREVRERRQVAAGRDLGARDAERSEEHTSELQSQSNLVCRLLLEKKKKNNEKK